MVNQNNIMQEIQNPKNWKKTHKKSYEVYMCRPQLGTKCQNKLEGTEYITDQQKQFILSGTSGELWVVEFNKLCSTYTFSDGTPINNETLKRKCDPNGNINWTLLSTKPDAGNCWAFFLPKSIQNFPVRYYTANRTGVGHGYGDFLLCDDIGGQPNLDRVRVVNGEVFPRTYDLHGFPNMFNENITKTPTPKPEKNFITSCSNEPENKQKVAYNTYIDEVNYLADKTAKAISSVKGLGVVKYGVVDFKYDIEGDYHDGEDHAEFNYKYKIELCGGLILDLTIKVCQWNYSYEKIIKERESSYFFIYLKTEDGNKRIGNNYYRAWNEIYNIPEEVMIDEVKKVFNIKQLKDIPNNKSKKSIFSIFSR